LSDTFTDDVASMTGEAALPRANGEFVFDAPWQGRAVALAVTLVDRLGVPWDEFRQRLIAAIVEDPERPYYDSWAVALEHLVVERGLTTAANLDAATPTERAPL
jgi:nitrile hydratase accessory protein